MKQPITVVVPTFDEAENIQPLAEQLQMALRGYQVHVLFIDDSPTRETAEAVYAAQATIATAQFTLQVRRRKHNRNGLAGAVVRGISEARADLVVVMDGDLQHPPELIPRLIEQAEDGADIVIASRYVDDGSADGLHGALRQFVSHAATRLTRLAFPRTLLRVSDPMTGFFLVRRQLIKPNRLRSGGFKILLEILVKHPWLRTAEIPFHFGERYSGESKAGLKQGREFLAQLAQLRFESYLMTIRSLPRSVQFAGIGGGVFGIGFVMLFVLVEIFHWHPLPANATQLAVTFALNFYLNKHLTWHDRTVDNLAVVRFVFSRGTTTFANFLLFAWFIAIGVQYLLANILGVALMTVANFVISDAWVFRDTRLVRPTLLPKRLRRLSTLLVILFALTLLYWVAGSNNFVAAMLTIASLAMFTQASIEIWRALYVYRVPEAVDRMRFPEATNKPREKFCLLVPARHEESVIGTTLLELAAQTHPDVTVVSVICDDDPGTLSAANSVAEKSSRVRVVTYRRPPRQKPNKPSQLNYAFEQLKDEHFTVFGVVDAEDTVHPDLLRHVDSALQDPSVGIVQGGVQLMNHDSRWFTLHNVLEYWRWFRSVMQFQADQQFVPLGGNTVFVRANLLKEAGGWPMSLTEDCALGVLLSTRFAAKVATHYEPRLATREEAPLTLHDLFFQRVRWVQGFYSEWRRGVWRELPSRRRRLVAAYILTVPVLLAFTGLVAPISFWAILVLKAPISLVLIMYLPLVPLMLQAIINVVYLYDFGREFNRKIRFVDYVNLLFTYLIYQVILNAAALWAMIREIRGNTTWHKTTHAGQHRRKPAAAFPQEATT